MVQEHQSRIHCRKLFFTALLFLTLAACGGGGGGGAPTPTPAPDAVTISGTISYDHIPHNDSNIGLNYSAITQNPVRGAVVELVSASGSVLATTDTSATGTYSFTREPNTEVLIRVKAQLLQTGSPSWDFKVTDNTNNNALYVLDGSLTSSGSSNSTRNLNADSGWGGSSYTSVRSAAPFAILDAIYDSVQMTLSAAPNVALPPSELRWSVNNRSVGGTSAAERAMGEIGSTSYVFGEGNIYITGSENSDTDEYDEHVIIHEWGHYFENRLARADTIGGPHSGGDRLDLRVAFSEGWANALSAIVTRDPIYKDAGGFSQNSGFSFSIESNNGINPGWFSETSVQSIIYDLFDSNDDSADSLSLGFQPIYDLLTSSSFRNQDALQSIFTFATLLREDQSSLLPSIDALLSAQSINGTDSFGAGETNDGGDSTPQSSILPVYKVLVVGGPATNVCSNTPFGDTNKLGNSGFIMFDVTTSRSYNVQINRVSGSSSVTDPDAIIWRRGAFIGSGVSAANGSENFSSNLNPGTHILEVYEFTNTDASSSNNRQACFSVTIN